MQSQPPNTPTDKGPSSVAAAKTLLLSSAESGFLCADHGECCGRRATTRTRRTEKDKERCPVCRASYGDRGELGDGKSPVGSALTSAAQYYPQQGLYGVVQGGVYADLRKESAAFVNE